MTQATASGRWPPLGLRIDDELSVADRLVTRGELEDPVEHEAAAARGAPVGCLAVGFPDAQERPDRVREASS